MGLKPSVNKLVCLMGFPHRYVHHVDRGSRVACTVVMAAKVPDQGADLQALNLLAFDRFNEPFVKVELLLPLDLGIHHSPCRSELVVDDHKPTVYLLLNVDGTADLDPIYLFKQTLLSDVTGSLPPLHHHMQGRSQHGPQHVRNIFLDLIVVLFAQTSNARRCQKLSNTVLCITLAVVFTGSQSHQWCWHSELVCYLHQDTS